MQRITVMHRSTAPNRRPIVTVAGLTGSLALSAAAFGQPAAPPPVSPTGRPVAVDTTSLEAQDRLKAAASLARWQALPAPSAGRWLLVNIPAYEISLYEGLLRTVTWRAIVGKAKTPTPRFAGSVTGVILNP